MSEELELLRQINPVAPEDLEQAVSVDRDLLLNALAADSGDRPPRLRLLSRPTSSSTRVGYVGAIAAAAAVLVGFVLLGGEDSPTNPDVASQGEFTPSTELAVPVTPRQDDGLPEATPTSESSVTLEASETPPSSASPPEESSPSTEQNPPTVTQPQPTSTTAPTSDTADPVPAPTIDGPFDGSLDLLVLHYDHSHRDDGHAAVAALEIANSFGLQPHVVAGTAPDTYQGFIHDFAPVMEAVWGDAWFDARADRPTATIGSVERWLETLDAGGRVWVAEGGVSDFTAEVVREIQRQRPDLDTRSAIRIVQHNDHNEGKTAPERLAEVQTETDYVRIDDGNSANETADLNQRSDALVAAALAGGNSARWAAAFDYLPAAELDFSDTVEVLHILGIEADEVANPDDFAEHFMG